MVILGARWGWGGAGVVEYRVTVGTTLGVAVH